MSSASFRRSRIPPFVGSSRTASSRSATAPRISAIAGTEIGLCVPGTGRRALDPSVGPLEEKVGEGHAEDPAFAERERPLEQQDRIVPHLAAVQELGPGEHRLRDRDRDLGPDLGALERAFPVRDRLVSPVSGERREAEVELDARLQLPHLERIARCGVEPLERPVGAPVLLLLDQQPDVGERREEREEIGTLRLDRGPDLLEQAELGEEVRARRERGRREPAAREDAERREGARGPELGTEEGQVLAHSVLTRDVAALTPECRHPLEFAREALLERVRDGIAHTAVPGQYPPLGPERLRRAEGREPGEGCLPEPAGHVRRRRQVRAVPPRSPRLPVR